MRITRKTAYAYIRMYSTSTNEFNQFTTLKNFQYKHNLKGTEFRKFLYHLSEYTKFRKKVEELDKLLKQQHYLNHTPSDDMADTFRFAIKYGFSVKRPEGIVNIKDIII